MGVPTLPRVRVDYELSPDVVEAYCEKMGGLGTPLGWDRREQLELLAATETVMPVVLRDFATGEVLAISATAFVRRAFFDECASAPAPWIMARAQAWASDGRRPFLDAAAVRRENSGPGLFLVIAIYTVFAADPVAHNALFGELLFAYLEKYRGYRLACVFAEPAVDAYVAALHEQGFSVVNGYPAHERCDGRAPLLMAIGRDRALLSHSHFVCRLFDYRVPAARLSPAGRELLAEAVVGGTDPELAEALGCARGTVKDRWARVYDSLDKNVPGYLPDPSFGTRGTEKRRKAVAFARQNPWELRPYDRHALRGLDAIESPGFGG